MIDRYNSNIETHTCKNENTINFSFESIENAVNEYTYDERENFIIDNDNKKINKLKQEIENLNNEKKENRG